MSFFLPSLGPFDCKQLKPNEFNLSKMREIFPRYRGSSQTPKTMGPWAETGTWHSWAIRTDVLIAPISHSAAILSFRFLKVFSAACKYACLRPPRLSETNTLFIPIKLLWDTESDCPCLSQVSSRGPAWWEVHGDTAEHGTHSCRQFLARVRKQTGQRLMPWATWMTNHESQSWAWLHSVP